MNLPDTVKIRWVALGLALGWVGWSLAQPAPSGQSLPAGAYETAPPAANRQRAEFAPPPGPYGRTLGALPGAGYFPPSWSVPAGPPTGYSLPNQFAPPAQTGMAQVPSPQASMPQLMPPSAQQPGIQWGNLPPAASWSGAQAEPRSASGEAWERSGPGYRESRPEFNPNAVAPLPAWSGQVVPGATAPAAALQWQAPPSGSRQDVIYPGITPVDSYAPQPTAVWPQSGYTNPSGAHFGRDQPVWPSASDGRQPPESQLFPRRTP